MSLMNNNNIITIITVTYNCADSLESTILSVINQSYFKFVEYIIIDGKSTDGTIDIIRKYEKFISKWISEFDNGIFDAMNKGIKLSTGQWINFMNSGDIFYNYDTINSIFRNLITDADVIYGNTIFKFENSTKTHIPSKDINKLKEKLFFSHQASFIKISTMKTYFYNLDYKYCSDYDFFFKLYKLGYKFIKLDIIININIANSGFSFNNKKESLREVSMISERNFIYIYSAFLIKQFIKHITGVANLARTQS